MGPSFLTLSVISVTACDEFIRFSGGYPGQPESFTVIAEIFEKLDNHVRTGHRFIITIQVMTFTEVSAKHHDAVSALVQSIDNKFRVNHS